MNPQVEGGLRPRRGFSAGRVGLAVAATLSTMTLAATTLWFPGVAHADNSLLCAGYAPCNTTGFTSHSYETAAEQSWWSMYPGINCTNYAAYVESDVYRVATPGLLLGDAYEWGDRAAEAGIPVDETPTVGAVAVWGANTPGMGSDGHVGVVEGIGADGSYIDVSQSGMGSENDGYSWERIYRNDTSWESWPSSFIHFSGAGIPSALPRAGARVPGAELVSAGG